MAGEVVQPGASPFTESVSDLSSEDDMHTLGTESVLPHRISSHSTVKSQRQDRADNNSSAEEQDSFRNEAVALQRSGMPLFVPLPLPPHVPRYDHISETPTHTSKIRRIVLFDMRAPEEREVYGTVFPTTRPLSLSLFSSQFSVKKELIFEATIKSKSTTVVIFSAKQTNICLYKVT